MSGNEVEQAVLAANERFYAAFAARESAALEALWALDIPIACTHPGWLTIHDRDAVFESWRRIMANPGQARVVAGDARVTLLGSTAIVHCREFVAGAALVATNVFVLQDANWRLVDHHSGPVAM